MHDVVQLVVNGLIAGTILAVPAIGITAIYAVLRFPNFAIASIATIGAFAGYVANVRFGMPALAAIAVAFIAAGIVGVISDEYVLKPIRPTGLLAAAIASVALTISLGNVVRFIFCNDLRGYDLPIQHDWRFLDIRIGPRQVENFAVAVLALTSMLLFLTVTGIGQPF